MREKTEADATEMPVIEANTALAKTVAMPSPAFTRRSIRSKMSNVSLPTPEIVTSRPISTNSGTMAKRYSSRLSLATEPSMRSATVSLRMKATAPKDDAIIATPIGMPSRIRRSRTAMAAMPISIPVIVDILQLWPHRAGDSAQAVQTGPPRPRRR